MSPEAKRQMRRDLSMKLQADLGDVLKRNVGVLHHVLDSVECGETLIEAAVMVVRTVGGSVATMGQNADTVEALYSATIDAIIESVTRSRTEALVRINLELSKRAAV